MIFTSSKIHRICLEFGEVGQGENALAVSLFWSGLMFAGGFLCVLCGHLRFFLLVSDFFANFVG